MRSAIADRTAATSTGDRVCNIRTAATCIDTPETSHTNSITSFWLARWVPIPHPTFTSRVRCFTPRTAAP